MLNLAFRKLGKDFPTLWGIRERSRVLFHAHSFLVRLSTSRRLISRCFQTCRTTTSSAGCSEFRQAVSHEIINFYPDTISWHFLQMTPSSVSRTMCMTSQSPAPLVSTKNEWSIYQTSLNLNYNICFRFFISTQLVHFTFGSWQTHSESKVAQPSCTICEYPFEFISPRQFELFQPFSPLCSFFFVFLELAFWVAFLLVLFSWFSELET